MSDDERALAEDLRYFGVEITPHQARVMVDKGWVRKDLVPVHTVKFSIPQNNLKDFGIKSPRGSISIQSRSL